MADIFERILLSVIIIHNLNIVTPGVIPNPSAENGTLGSTSTADNSTDKDTLPTQISPENGEGEISSQNRTDRGVGQTRFWLIRREQGIHANNNTLLNQRHHTRLPWGDGYRAEPIAKVIPDISLPDVGEVMMHQYNSMMTTIKMGTKGLKI